MTVSTPTHRKALERADRIVDWMSKYIGRMAPPDNGIANLNEHWLYMERLRRREKKPPVMKRRRRGHVPLDKAIRFRSDQ